MRDLVVREGLRATARDASKLFRELIRAGEEIPYEVREPGDGSPLCRYEPLTERFIRDHAGSLRELDSFGASCAALEAADLSGPYLEQLGISVPPQPRARAELAAIVFLCRLWTDCGDFSIERERLEATIAELEAGESVTDSEIELIVPLRGFVMDTARLDLPSAAIVRADTVEVPAEARAGETMGASPWEPTFLAVVRVPLPDADDPEGADLGARATAGLRRLITTLRLFKPGGVALGPHAWTLLGGDRWRRIATGAGRPRPGGYRLADEEISDLVTFSRALASPSTPFGRDPDDRPALSEALGRALSRFEAGLERTVALDALNDNLLALRFVLEGGGPADLGLSMRIAALCAEPEHRDDVKTVVDRALALERELWSGEPQDGGETPAEVAAELEILTRAILKDAACGHLGNDLRSTADEILLADGFAVGDGAAAQRGATAEWDPVDEEPDGGEAEDEAEDETPHEPAVQDPGVKVIGRPGRIWLEAEADEEERVIARRQRTDLIEAERPVRSSPVLELIERTRSERAARADRVANLFPRPDTVEWNVRELGHDRHRANSG